MAGWLEPGVTGRGYYSPTPVNVYRPTAGSAAQAALANQIGMGNVHVNPGGGFAVGQMPFVPPNAAAVTGGSTATTPEATAAEQEAAASMDPMLAFMLAQSAAARALALTQARNKTDAGLQSLGVNLATGRADLADAYNRNSPLVATDYLRRGMATSGIAQTGIARFHQDYVKSVNKLESEYQNARTQLLMELSAVESDTSQQAITDMLNTLLKTAPTTG